jgi:lipopolysaccharide export system permease protein
VNILDRYIARQYLINIGILLVLLFSFVVVVDVSLNLARFVSEAQEQLKQSGSQPSGLRLGLVTALAVVDLWWPRLLQLFNYVLGLVLIGAMGFTFAQLVRHRELVAVMASGISLYRMIRPILIVSVLMLGVQVANQEILIPRIAHLIARDNRDIGQREYSSFRVNLVADGQRRLFQASDFDPRTGVLTSVNIWERDDQGLAVRRISADSAIYRDGQWVLTNGIARPVAIAGLDASNPAAMRGQRVAAVASGLDPNALLTEQYRIYGHSRSLAQLFTAAGNPNVKAEVRDQFLRIAWGRIALLVCTLLSLIVAIPFFLTREPKNMILQSLKCAPVALGSLLGSIIGTAAPIPGLPVEFAVWLPVLALLPTAIAMGASIKT